MSTSSIRDARPDDLPAVLALLRDARLPEDVEPHLASFLIAEREGGIVGVVGLEVLEGRALLRSLVVSRGERRAGIGRSLARAAIEKARSRSIRELLLLTIDAAPFFEILGFRRLPREEAPLEVRATKEFSELCPSAATLMALRP